MHAWEDQCREGECRSCIQMACSLPPNFVTSTTTTVHWWWHDTALHSVADFARAAASRIFYHSSASSTCPNPCITASPAMSPRIGTRARTQGTAIVLGRRLRCDARRVRRGTVHQERGFCGGTVCREERGAGRLHGHASEYSVVAADGHWQASSAQYL